MFNVLRLSALPVRGDHQTACYPVRCLRPEPGPHEMQARIQSGCRAGRSQHVTMIDVQHGLIEDDIRVPDSEGIERLPVRDCPTPGKQASICYGDSAKAESQDSHAPLVRLLKDPA